MALSVEARKAHEAAAAEYVGLRDAWQRYFKYWFATYYILGTLLFLCSATAASAKQLGLSDPWPAIFAWLVVILTAAIGFYKPDDRASRYRQAWSLIRVQLSRFLYDETYTLNDVITAYQQGESIIHQTPAAPQPAQKS
jgi:hypothetical protein